MTAALESRLADFGFDAEPAAARLAAFHRVENTYIATFQTLGALGLLLGTLGLGAVLVRNAFEQRRELALLRAVGYRARDVRTHGARGERAPALPRPRGRRRRGARRHRSRRSPSAPRCRRSSRSSRCSWPWPPSASSFRGSRRAPCCGCPCSRRCARSRRLGYDAVLRRSDEPPSRAPLAGFAPPSSPSGAPGPPDWPQWRGPARDGRVSGLAARAGWPETLTPGWKVKVGTGHSSPVVVRRPRVPVLARGRGRGRARARPRHAAASCGGRATRSPTR